MNEPKKKTKYHVYCDVTKHPPAPTVFAAPEVEPWSTVCDDVMIENMDM